MCAGVKMLEEKMISYLENIKIQQYKSDVGFRTLVESVNDNLYIIPHYQRKYRWTKAQVKELVYSLIKGFPIPPIYTYRNQENQLEILDGQQRIMSLFFYYIGKYMNPSKNSVIDFSSLDIRERTFEKALIEDCKLLDLHIEMITEDKSIINIDYNSLPKAIKRRIDYIPITVIEIKIDQQTRKEATLRAIFANLNRGGTLLSDQEQRNGIYSCTFYEMLQTFNRTDERWRKIWGRESKDSSDIEMLLRFCALDKHTEVNNGGFIVNGYAGSYIKLLDQFSEEVLVLSEAEVLKYRENLRTFMSLFQENYCVGTKVALLESLYVVCKKKNLKMEITKSICNEIMMSDSYKQNTRQGTVAMKKMNERWKGVYEILSKYH